MDGPTPLLKAELEALAKLCAKQPHALELKEYFILCFKEERSRVAAMGLNMGKVKLLSDCSKLSEI